MNRRVSPNRAKYRHQLAAGRLVLLALAVLTLINQLLLLCRVEYHFLLSAAVPYYVNWLWFELEAGGFWAVVNVLLTLCLDGFYCICWFLSGRRRICISAALAAYGLDTLLLVIFTFTMLDNPVSCLLEILTHVGVLYLLLTADQAAAALQRMQQRSRL